ASVLAALDALDEARPSTTPSVPGVSSEQQLLSVLMATAIEDDPRGDLHRELAGLGARLEVLSDGSRGARPRQRRGAARDQAAQAARCALLIKPRFPGAGVALGTGGGLADERASAGEVFDRAAALLRDHTREPVPSQILLDDGTRGLL